MATMEPPLRSGKLIFGPQETDSAATAASPARWQVITDDDSDLPVGKREILFVSMRVTADSDDSELGVIYSQHEETFDSAITSAVKEVLGEETALFYCIGAGSIGMDFGASPPERRRFNLAKLKRKVVGAIQAVASALKPLRRPFVLTVEAVYSVVRVEATLRGLISGVDSIWPNGGSTGNPFKDFSARLHEWLEELWRRWGWGLS